MWKHPLQWCQGVQAVRLGAQSHTAHAEPVLGCLCTQIQDSFCAMHWPGWTHCSTDIPTVHA